MSTELSQKRGYVIFILIMFWTEILSEHLPNINLIKITTSFRNYGLCSDFRRENQNLLSCIHLLSSLRKQSIVLPIQRTNLINFSLGLAEPFIELIEMARCFGSLCRHNLRDSIIELSKRIRMWIGNSCRDSVLWWLQFPFKNAGCLGHWDA